MSCERPPLYFRVILLFFRRTNFWDSMTAAANQDGGYCTAFAVRLRRALKIMLVCCIGGRCLYCTSKESTSSYSCLAATADDFCKNCFAWRLLLLYRASNQIPSNIGEFKNLIKIRGISIRLYLAKKIGGIRVRL